MDKRSNTIPAITGQIDHLHTVRLLPPALNPYKATILAYASSLVSTTVGFPLDTVKTRMQAYKSFSSMSVCVVSTLQHEGVRGFFRGIWAPLISTSFLRSLMVTLFTASKPYCHDAIWLSRSGNPFLQNLPVCFAAGAFAGTGVSLFACPFEFTKVYSQLASVAHQSFLLAEKAKPPHISTWSTVKNIVKYEGLSGLYTGYRYQFLRDAAGLGVYFAVYESFKWACNAVLNSDPSQSSPLSVVLAGGLSGVACWASIFPVDTTKALIQRDVVTNILRREQGMDPLPPKKRTLTFNTRIYRGLSVSTVRSFLVSMVFFTTFEFAMKHID